MFEELVQALNNTGFAFAHHAWSKAPSGDYGVYAEESGEDFIADSVHAETGIVCYVNYYTRDGSMTPKNTIEAALNSIRIPWQLNTVQYENDTGYIHFEWECGVYG